MYSLTHCCCFFFFFYHPATSEIYTLSLHDALPISWTAADNARCDPAQGFLVGGFSVPRPLPVPMPVPVPFPFPLPLPCLDRKSTRLNSSHLGISYAVFCLKKKKNKIHITYISYLFK